MIRLQRNYVIVCFFTGLFKKLIFSLYYNPSIDLRVRFITKKKEPNISIEYYLLFILQSAG